MAPPRYMSGYRVSWYATDGAKNEMRMTPKMADPHDVHLPHPVIFLICMVRNKAAPPAHPFLIIGRCPTHHSIAARSSRCSISRSKRRPTVASLTFTCRRKVRITRREVMALECFTACSSPADHSLWYYSSWSHRWRNTAIKYMVSN